MDSVELPHRCPECNALVVDRRSPACTTCRAALPAAWVMTPAQAAKTTALDKQSQATFAASRGVIDPASDPNTPYLIRLLDTDVRGL